MFFWNHHHKLDVCLLSEEEEEEESGCGRCRKRGRLGLSHLENLLLFDFRKKVYFRLFFKMRVNSSLSLYIEVVSSLV